MELDNILMDDLNESLNKILFQQPNKENVQENECVSETEESGQESADKTANVEK